MEINQREFIKEELKAFDLSKFKDKEDLSLFDLEGDGYISFDSDEKLVEVVRIGLGYFSEEGQARGYIKKEPQAYATIYNWLDSNKYYILYIDESSWDGVSYIHIFDNLEDAKKKAYMEREYECRKRSNKKFYW